MSEFSVPVGEKLAAQAQKNDAFEETLHGVKCVLPVSSERPEAT